MEAVAEAGKGGQDRMGESFIGEIQQIGGFWADRTLTAIRYSVPEARMWTW